MNDWIEVKLTELGKLGRGKSKHRPRDASHLYGGDYPFIQTGDIKAANHKIYNYSQTYSEAGLAQSKLWPKGTICITIAANIADSAMLSFPACFPDSVLGFIPNKEKCDGEFIEYLLQHYQKEIKTHSIGSVQENINLGTFEKVKFIIPPLPTQKVIAEILSSLDDKIELNNQINQNLEALAQSLFKHWFVDFEFPNENGEPYKSSGGEMVDSELGKIPKGWSICMLSEVTEKITDGAHHSPKSEENGFPMASVKDMTTWDIDLSSCRKISEEDYLKLAQMGCKPRKGDVLIAKDGSFLKHTFVLNEEIDLVLLSSIAILRPNEKINSHILNLFLKEESVKERLQNIVTGAVIQRIVLKDFRSFKIVNIPIETQRKFNKVVDSFYDKIWAVNMENENLTNLRDLLLPKLISGELEVSESLLEQTF